MAKCTERDPLSLMNRFAKWTDPPKFDAKWAAALGAACDELAAANAEIERLRAEVEDARAYITTDDGSKLHIRNLLRCGMRSLKRKRGAFWSNVADAFGVGSTSAHRLCRFALLDPDTGQPTEDHPHA